MTCSVDTVIEERGTAFLEEHEWTVVGGRTFDLDSEGRVLRIRSRNGTATEVERGPDEVIGHVTGDGFVSIEHYPVADGRLVGHWTEYLVDRGVEVPPEQRVDFGFEATRDRLGRLLTVTTSSGASPRLYTWDSERLLLIEDSGYAYWKLTFDERGAIERVIWTEWHNPCRGVTEDEFPMCPSLHPAGWEQIGVMTRKGRHTFRYVLTGDSDDIFNHHSYVSGREIHRYRRGRLVEVVLRRSGGWAGEARRIRHQWTGCPATVRGEPPWEPVPSEPELLWGWPIL